MLDKIKKIWKKRKVIGRVIKYIRSNSAWVDLLFKALKYSKDGYTRSEMAELLSDVLKIFKKRASISYADEKVTLEFYMRR